MNNKAVPLAPVVVRLPGEIDLANRKQACCQVSAAFAAGARVVVADFTATSYCDAAGLGGLVAVQRRVAARGGELRMVIPAGGAVDRVAELMGLDRMVLVFSGLREATAALWPRVELVEVGLSKRGEQSVQEAADEHLAWSVGQLVSDLTIAARSIGIDERALVAELGLGQTIAQVARRNGVKPHRVVVALVSAVMADVATDIRRGDFTKGQIRRLVGVATLRAEAQVMCSHPQLGFRLAPAASARRGGPRQQAAWRGGRAARWRHRPAADLSLPGAGRVHQGG